MPQKVVEIDNEQQLIKKFERMAHVLNNLRFFTKYWNENGGFQARDRKKYWENEADKCLNELGITSHNNLNSVKVIKY